MKNETNNMTPAQAKNALKKLPKSKLIAIIINLSDKVDELSSIATKSIEHLTNQFDADRA